MATTPGVEIGLLMRRVRDRVAALTHGDQKPEIVVNLGSQEIYLAMTRPSPVTVAPRAVDDHWIDLEGGKTYRLPVLGNDVASVGGRLRVASVGQVSEGRAEISGDGTEILYTAPAGKAGGELSFSYQVREDGGGEAEGRVVLVLARTVAVPLPLRPTEVPPMPYMK